MQNARGKRIRRINGLLTMVDSLKKEVEELKSRRGANNGFSVFLGNSNKPLGKKICSYLKKQISNAKVTTFSDNEVQIEIKENVRQKDVYVIQSICSDDNRSVNDYLTELLLMISTFKRASAGRITVRWGIALRLISCSTGWWVGPSSPTPILSWVKT